MSLGTLLLIILVILLVGGYVAAVCWRCWCWYCSGASDVKTWVMEIGDLMRFANEVKDALAQKMEPCDVKFDEWTVVIAQKGWFGRIKDRLFAGDDSGIVITALRNGQST